MTGQEEFDTIYITSSEICKALRVTRAAVVNARKRGLLPDPIVVNDQILIWKRNRVKPYLEAWDISLQSRRGELVA